MHRRKFLIFSTTAATAAVIGVSCDKDDDKMNNTEGVNLGSGDTGILNYAYALEQLEAAFYTQVIATPFSGITTSTLCTFFPPFVIVHSGIGSFVLKAETDSYAEVARGFEEVASRGSVFSFRFKSAYFLTFSRNEILMNMTIIGTRIK